MNKKFIFVFLFLTAFLVLQAYFISCYLPFNEWFSPSLMYNIDFPLHYDDVLNKKFLLENYGAIWGYNPYQRAGTVQNVIIGIDNHGWALWVYLLPFLSDAVAFKLYFIILILVIPLLLYGAARNFELERGESMISVVLGTVVLHATLCADFLYAGSVSYIASAYISLYIASLAYRFFRTGSVPVLIWQTVLLGAALWIHIFTVINGITFFMALYCALGIRQNRQRLGLSLASLFGASLLATPWLIPFIKFLDTSRPNPVLIEYTTTDMFAWVDTYFLGQLNFGSTSSPVVDIGLMLFGIAGLVWWWRDGQRIRTAAFGYMIAFLFLLTYYGSFTFTRVLMPLRFMITMNLFLVVPASAAMCSLYRWGRSRLAMVKILAPACALIGLYLLMRGPYTALFLHNEFQLQTQLPKFFEDFITYTKSLNIESLIGTKTKDASRILIEHSNDGTGRHYAGGTFPSLLPRLTGREFIGNDYAWGPTWDGKSTFADGILFQQPIETADIKDIELRCKIYNIGWVICWSEKAKAFFNRFPDFFIFYDNVAVGSFYRVNKEASFFLKGAGSVKASMNRIELENLTPEDGEIIISYHWMKYFKTDPPLELGRVFFLDDPVGFIQLKNPPKSVVIYNNYK